MSKIEQQSNPGRTSGIHQSYWIDSVQRPSFPEITSNLTTDVVIIGGGIAGISIAYNLVKQGKSVVLLEDGEIGSGETGRTTAHLVTALDDRYYEIARVFGKGGAKLAAESHAAAVSFVENAVRENNIDCDFERLDGYLFADPSDDPKSLDREFEAATEAGVNISRADKIPGIKGAQQSGLVFHQQAQFHPLKYLSALALAVTTRGGKIFTHSKAIKIGSKQVDTENGFRISADHVVVATNSPINNKYVMHLKQFAYRTYVIGATIKKGSLGRALWWDTGDYEKNSEIPPYHYVRLQPYNQEYDLLISGGEDHAVGLPESIDATEESSYAKLIGWTRGKFDIGDVIYRWSGQVLEPMDSLGYIGRNPMDDDNVYIVTGDSGNGLTHATIAGMLIPDLILGKENPWTKLYDPSRLHVFRSGKTFLKEYVGGFIQYIKHQPKHVGDVRLDDIAPGKAGIVQLGKEKYGAYRDENNQLHIVGATCTHLGCLVKWNSDEKSWDCPCHGSRFTFDGKVMNGPAIENLIYLRESVPEPPIE